MPLIKCAHRGLELDFDGDGDFFDDSGQIRCKAHDAKFDIDSGECTKGPRDCMGKKRLIGLHAFEEDGNIIIGSIPKKELDFRQDFKIVKQDKGK